MKLPENIEKIEIYYDGHCGMCCTFQEWLHEQKRAFEVQFVPYQSESAKELCPKICELEPDREMIVRTKNGEIYRGAEGWVLSLFSCKKYQDVARRLANPVLLPFAEKVCRAIASRRYKLSRIFFSKKDNEVAEKLHEMTEGNPLPKRRVDQRNICLARIPDGIL